MKRYAVFAKKTEKAQAPGDYTIWHFLNDTDDIEEAHHWYLHARDQPEVYRQVQVVQPTILLVVKTDSSEQ